MNEPRRGERPVSHTSGNTSAPRRRHPLIKPEFREGLLTSEALSAKCIFGGVVEGCILAGDGPMETDIED